MAIFNSYVKLPEGNWWSAIPFDKVIAHDLTIAEKFRGFWDLLVAGWHATVAAV